MDEACGRSLEWTKPGVDEEWTKPKDKAWVYECIV